MRVYAFSAFSLSFHKDYRLMFFFFGSDFSLLIFVYLAVLGLRCCISLAAVSGVCLLWSRGRGPPWAQYLQLAGSGAQAQSLWRLGLVAPWHVGSSWTRDQTHVPCIGRQILNHWPPKKVLFLLFFDRICLISLMMSSMHRRFTCICFCMSLWYWNKGGGDFRFLFCYPLEFMTPASPNSQLDLNPWDTCFHFSLFLYFLFLFWKSSVPFSSVTQSCLTFCDPMNHSTPGLPVTNSRSLLKSMSIESMMPSNHLILCHSLLLLLPIPPSIRAFSNESTLRMRWPKYWSFSWKS